MHPLIKRKCYVIFSGFQPPMHGICKLALRIHVYELMDKLHYFHWTIVATPQSNSKNKARRWKISVYLYGNHETVVCPPAECKSPTAQCCETINHILSTRCTTVPIRSQPLATTTHPRSAWPPRKLLVRIVMGRRTQDVRKMRECNKSQRGKSHAWREVRISKS